MQNGLQINLNVLRISRLFLSNPVKRRCGHDVAKTLGLKVSTTYNVLWRLQESNWLTSAHEAERLNGQPARRMYHLTDYGRAAAGQAFAALNMGST